MQITILYSEVFGQALGRVLLSRVTVVILTLFSVLPASRGFRDLQQDNGEQSTNFRYVSTPTDLVAAAEDGVRHVVITQHLDLTDLSAPLSTLTAGVIETAATATIQVRFCTALRCRAVPKLRRDELASGQTECRRLDSPASPTSSLFCGLLCNRRT